MIRLSLALLLSMLLIVSLTTIKAKKTKAKKYLLISLIVVNFVFVILLLFFPTHSCNQELIKGYRCKCLGIEQKGENYSTCYGATHQCQQNINNISCLD